jgi:Ca2+-transporting ATPase
MASLHQGEKDKKPHIYIKGALEQILARCSHQLDAAGALQPLNAQEIEQEAGRLAGQGVRVLAFAGSPADAGRTQIAHEDLLHGLHFYGLQGMIDPPREEAKRAIAACREAGIKVKMITGDHALTAAAIAKKLELEKTHPESEEAAKAVTGQQLAKMTDQELIAAAEKTAVFARVAPEQKLRIVYALQAKKQVVAMTGDGVNDAPALKQADIGVAMGITGTEVAKDACDIILTDDNFASIEAAVEEGRGVFDNLTKFIVWTLPTNLGQGLVILAAIFSGAVLPLLPVQILWINMTTAVLLGLVLAFEPKEKGIMTRPPRDPGKPLLTRYLVWRILFVSAILLAGSFYAFNYELAQGASVEKARTMAVNIFVMVQLFYLFNCRSLTQSMFAIGVLSNRWVVAGVGIMLGLQFLFTYAPFMQTAFKSAPLNLGEWGLILLLGLAGYILVGIEKWVANRWGSRRV